MSLYTFETNLGWVSFYALNYDAACKHVAASGACRIVAAFRDGLPIRRGGD